MTSVTAGFPSKKVAWITTFYLALLYWLAILDRYIISLLVDPIKKDLGLTDVQMGLLHGFAFAVTFAGFGLIAGYFADRYKRNLVIFASVSIWSLATAACGMVNSFWQMMWARIGVGFGEAGLNPCAVSIIADMHPKKSLTKAMAVYFVGASIGSGCAYLLGGLLVQYVSNFETVTFPVLGEVRSWQAAFIYVGFPGLLLGIPMLFISEPARRGSLANKGRQIGQGFIAGYITLWKFLRQNKYYLYHFFGFGFPSFVVIAGSAWYPAHMSRTFGWSPAEVGASLGLMTLLSSALGKVICGFVVDWLYAKGYKDAHLRFYAWGMLLSMPFGVFGMIVDSPWLFFFCMGFFMLFVAMLAVIANAAMSMVTPNEYRGTTTAFFGATTGMIAMTLGPLLVALFSKHLFGDASIGKGLAVLIAICIPLAGFTLLKGMASFKQAVIAAEQEDV